MLIETCIDNNEISLEDEEMERYNALAIDLGLEHLAYTQDKAQIAPMNNSEVSVYKTVCKTKIELDKYGHHIPERVLQAMKATKSFLEQRAKKNNYQLEFEVWIDENPDPVLICRTDYHEYFMIGRWGTELDTFNELRKRAIERIKGELVENIAKAESIVNVYKKNPDTVALMKLNNQLNSIYF